MSEERTYTLAEIRRAMRRRYWDEKSIEDVTRALANGLGDEQ